MKKLITLTVVAFLICVVSINAQMRPKMDDKPVKRMDMNCMMGKGHMDKDMRMMKYKKGIFLGYMFYQRVAEEIKLTDSQLQKIRDLDFKAKEELIDLKAKMQHLGLKMKQMMLDDNFNKQDLLSLNKKILQLKSQMEELNFKTKLEMYSVLTAEQRKNLKDLKMNRGMPRMDR